MKGKILFIVVILAVLAIIYLVTTSKIESNQIVEDEPVEEKRFLITPQEAVMEAIGAVGKQARIKDCQMRCFELHPYSASNRSNCFYKCQ